MSDGGSDTWIGLDIGGANLKAFHESGTVRIVPFALWKQPQRLAERLEGLLEGMPPANRFAVTMTGEICDCFPTRSVGVRAILDAVIAVVPESAVRVWGIDGTFHNVDQVRDAPLLAAAANWLATAMVAARLRPDRGGLLIDVGSTTTDLIPFREGAVAVVGRTDTERLQTGELVYAGVTRTPICALAAEIPWNSGTIGLCAEVFATTRDVGLILGDLSPDPYDLDTADGRPSTVDGARGRLARMVGGDRESISDEEIVKLATAVQRVLVDRLVASSRRIWRGAGLDQLEVAVVAGSGEFLAHRVALCLVEKPESILSLAKIWGQDASIAACAHALITLAKAAET